MLVRNGASGAFVLSLGCSQHGVYTCTHAAIEVALLKPWCNFLLDDALAHGSRQRGFETVTGLNEKLSVSLKDEKDRAVALSFLSDLPCVKSPSGKILQCRALGQPIEDRDENLVRGGSLKLCELFIQGRSGGGRNHARVVVKVAGWLRRGSLPRAKGHREQRDKKEGPPLLH